jgi:hypothetical protein
VPGSRRRIKELDGLLKMVGGWENMEVKLSPREIFCVIPGSTGENYAKCFTDVVHYGSRLNWSFTRQGHGYWEDKLEDEDWPWDIHNKSNELSKNLVKNLTYSDKVYISLLFFSRRHKISTFGLTDQASEGVNIWCWVLDYRMMSAYQVLKRGKFYTTLTVFSGLNLSIGSFFGVTPGKVEITGNVN